MFFQLQLRLRFQNTAELLNPDSLTPLGTNLGGGRKTAIIKLCQMKNNILLAVTSVAILVTSSKQLEARLKLKVTGLLSTGQTTWTFFGDSVPHTSELAIVTALA